MQYIGLGIHFTFPAAASNDNDDLLAFAFPAFELATIRGIKYLMRRDNMLSGILLSSRKERRFFEEVSAAERYLQLRYFTPNTPTETLQRLKRHILDSYLMPKRKRRSKHSTDPRD